MTTGELARRLGAELLGSPDLPIHGVASLEGGGAGTIAALLAPRWRRAARDTRATAVVVSPTLASELPPDVVRLLVDTPRDAWGQAVRALYPRPVVALPPVGVDPRAAIDPTARIGDGARVGPFVTVGAGATVGERAALCTGAYVGAGASVGADTTLHPRATLLDGCSVGARTLLCTGVVVGSPGFGIDGRGRVPQVGVAIVGDDVTIGANSCVDRGSVSATRIESGAHLDNLVQVGHNASVGPGAVLCAQVGLAGGARVEAGAVLAGQAGVDGYTTVGPGARVGAKSGVTRDLPGGADYSGFPAEPNRPRLRRIARLRRLVREPRDPR